MAGGRRRGGRKNESNPPAPSSHDGEPTWPSTQCAIADHGSHESPHPCEKHTVRPSYVSRTWEKKGGGEAGHPLGAREGREGGAVGSPSRLTIKEGVREGRRVEGGCS